MASVRRSNPEVSSCKFAFTPADSQRAKSWIRVFPIESWQGSIRRLSAPFRPVVTPWQFTHFSTMPRRCLACGVLSPKNQTNCVTIYLYKASL